MYAKTLLLVNIWSIEDGIVVVLIIEHTITPRIGRFYVSLTTKSISLDQDRCGHVTSPLIARGNCQILMTPVTHRLLSLAKGQLWSTSES